MVSTRPCRMNLSLVIALLMVAIIRQLRTLGMDDVSVSMVHKTSYLTTPKARTSHDVTGYDYFCYVSVPLLFVTGLLGNSVTLVVMAGRGFRSMPVRPRQCNISKRARRVSTKAHYENDKIPNLFLSPELIFHDSYLLCIDQRHHTTVRYYIQSYCSKQKSDGP